MAPPGRAPAKVTTFPITARHAIPTTICAVAMVLSARRSFIEPGSPLYDTLLAGQKPETLATVQDWAFRVLWGIHPIEAVLFAATKLRGEQSGVAFLSGVWWKWMVAMFCGGVSTWGHWARAVKWAAEAQKGKTT